jgi:hypothetical protein
VFAAPMLVGVIGSLPPVAWLDAWADGANVDGMLSSSV